MNTQGAGVWPVLLAVLGLVLFAGTLVLGQFMIAIPLLILMLIFGIGALVSRRRPNTPDAP